MRNKQEIYEEKILKQYDKLINKLASEVYKNYNQKYALEDLIVEAKLGAIKGLRCFDPSKNVKLITHLHNYIKFNMSHYIRANSGVIKVPKNPAYKIIPEIDNYQSAFLILYKYFLDEKNELLQIKKKNLEIKEKLEKLNKFTNKEFRKLQKNFIINYKNNIAILDTHILKFIKENIDDKAPKSTPTIRVTYKYWEDLFLYWCQCNNKNVADFDLEVWKSYARTAK